MFVSGIIGVKMGAVLSMRMENWFPFSTFIKGLLRNLKGD